jgi:hypothetical protein
VGDLVSGSFHDPASRQQPRVWQWFAVQHKATQVGLRRQLSIQTDGGHLEEVAANEVGQGCSGHDDGSVPASELDASSTAIAARLSSSNVNM